jgi:hypothetical protein
LQIERQDVAHLRFVIDEQNSRIHLSPSLYCGKRICGKVKDYRRRGPR